MKPNKIWKCKNQEIVNAITKLISQMEEYRREKETGETGNNFMRQYDLAMLLENKIVDGFTGTNEYKSHISKRFPPKDAKIPLSENEAFLLNDPQILEEFTNRFN